MKRILTSALVLALTIGAAQAQSTKADKAKAEKKEHKHEKHDKDKGLKEVNLTEDQKARHQHSCGRRPCHSSHSEASAKSLPSTISCAGQQATIEGNVSHRRAFREALSPVDHWSAVDSVVSCYWSDQLERVSERRQP